MKCIIETTRDKMTFGRYKGFSIQEVFNGKSYLNHHCLEEYLKAKPELLDMKIFPNILYQKFKIIKIQNSQVFVTPDLISTLKSNNNLLLDILPKLKTGYFLDLNLDLFDFQQFCFDNFEQMELISSSPNIIIWYIKNVENFSINPNVFKEILELPVWQFQGIELKFRVQNGLSYKPYFTNYKIELRKDLIDMNEMKYLNHTSKNFSNRNNNHSYNQFNGSYAQDIMGFSDQDINDAFEGDPGLYWNID